MDKAGITDTLVRCAAKLMRHGYDVHILNLGKPFNVKTAEIRQFLQGALDAERTRELTDQMLAAGLPLWASCSSDRLTECGSAPVISGWSQGMWVPSQIMWAGVPPQSQRIRAETHQNLAPKLR